MEYLRNHPIQMRSISVLELHIKRNPLSDNEKCEFGAEDLSLLSGHNEYDENEKTIQVGLKLELGLSSKKANLPFSMKIDLAAEFVVDENRFKKEDVTDWAERNAPLILYPYLREHAYSLTIRCGFAPITLPLLEVSTFTVKKPRRKA